MSAAEKHHKIRQHQPNISLEKKIARKMPSGGVKGSPLQGLGQTLGNHGMRRFLAASQKNEPPKIDTVQRAGTTAKQDADSTANAKAVFEKAQQTYIAGDYAKAAELYQQSSDLLGGTKGSIFFNIAQCYKKLNDFPKAIEFYQKFIQKDPTSEYVQEAKQKIKSMQGIMQPFLTGNRLYIQGDYASAAIWYSRALEVVPAEKKGHVYYNLAQANRKLKRYAVAISYYERYIKLDPGSEYISEAQKFLQEARNQIGVNQDIAGEVMEISEEAAKEIFAQATQAYLDRRYEEAMNMYMEVMQEYSGGSNPKMLFNIAQCNRMLGRKATAIHFFERCLEEGIADEFKEECKQKIADLRKALGWPDKDGK